MVLTILSAVMKHLHFTGISYFVGNITFPMGMSC